MLWLIALSIFIIFLSILSFGFFICAQAFNLIFFSFDTKQVLGFSIIINALYLILMMLTMWWEKEVLLEIFRILSYYLWILLYAALVAAVFRITYIVSKRGHHENNIVSHPVWYLLIAIIVGIVTVWIYNFEKGIQVKNIIIESPKINKDYKFVQIWDTQLGSTSQKHLEKTIKLALEQNPDFIVFVGDLVDTTNYHVDNFSVFSKLSIPLYFISGNHEYLHQYSKLTNILETYPHIKILDNEKVSHEEIAIIGIGYKGKDWKTKNWSILSAALDHISLDNQQYSILLYHEPKDIEIWVKKWFDLMLYGHTHGGQLFPLNLITQTIYPHSKGFRTVESTSIYTTLGAWLWGPKMRIWSHNEIVVFQIQAQEK